MARYPVDLRWFDDVLVLLEERNMTRAAERRNITQPAFSRRIRAFEQWLGTPLLDRRANSVRLSPMLLASEAEIRSLVLRIEELRNRMKTFKPERSHVTLAAQHALVFSAFPDFATLIQQHLPALSFRLRAGNKNECMSLFLRGDASMLMCFEAEHTPPMPFDASILRDELGHDRLVPVVGGLLRERCSDGAMPEDTPAIVYPEKSYFGEMLMRSACRFSTRALATYPMFESAFTAGIKDLVMKGLGIAWLPASMVHEETEDGQLLDLSHAYGSVSLTIALYTNAENDIAGPVRALWLREASV